MNPVFDEPPNPTNVEDTLQRIKSDDSSLTDVNLNNIKVRKRTPFQKLLTLGSNSCDMTLSLVCLFFSPEHSHSHTEGVCQGYGKQHSRQEVQSGGHQE